MPGKKEKSLEFITKSLLGLASICVRKGLRVQDVLEPLKEAFVRASQEELFRLEQPVNTSRLAAMTGLQRRDIQRLLDGGAPGSEAVSFFAKLINSWTSDKNFSSKGRPKVLNCEGANSEFAKLVASISRDINSYTALFELERMNIVSREEGKVRLIYDIYLTTEDEGLEIMADDIKDLAYAVQQNIKNESAVPNLHISTRYDNLALSKLEKIRDWLLKEGAAFHARARDYIQQYDKDINPDLKNEKGGGKVVLGAFSRIIEPKIEVVSNEKD